MTGTVTISKGGIVVVSDQNVIISGITPVSLSWTNDFSNYNIFNSTLSSIPLAFGFYYYDIEGNKQNTIPPNYYLEIILWTDGTWHFGSPEELPGFSGSSDDPDSFPGPFRLPIASATILGAIKVGLNLIIDPSTGVLSATGLSPLTSMPLASQVGIAADGTDQTANLNAAFLNPAYAGIIMDYYNPSPVTISGTVNCQGKLIVFYPGSYFRSGGGGVIGNFMLSCGLRQKCFDIGTTGVPTLTVNPIGTTLSVISPWVFGARNDGTDIARALQATVDLCIRNLNVSKIVIPSGTYICGSPILEYLWTGSNYAFHQISIEGETNMSEASGYGVTINFSSRKNSFGFGTQRGKGSSFKNIKLVGGFNYVFPGNYTFYSTPWQSMTDGVSRDTTYSPNSAIVVDPFGPAIPADGGWPGNDAYGVSLSTYYRGSGMGGSTGIELEDIFITNWVIGVISSPSGQTQNAELLTAWKIQFANMKVCIASCQAQEKLNVFRHIQSWGTTGVIFATGIYGAASPGSYWVQGVNIAGFSHSFIYNNQAQYFPSYFADVYSELLGSFGVIGSTNGTTILDSTFNFADYISAAGYNPGQITGQGAAFIGCQIRLYGTNKPVTINAQNGALHFMDCGFETTPFFNQENGSGLTDFQNCVVFDVGRILNPISMATLNTASPLYFSNTFAYGDIKIKIGTPFAALRTYNISSSVPAVRMPINRTTGSYVVTTALVGGFYEAVITCGADELNRVFLNDVIVGDVSSSGVNNVMGIVSAVGGGTFTIKYVPSWVVSGSNYFLYVWLQFKNISFTGDTTSASNLITNVVLIDGSLTDFTAGTHTQGGLMLTRAFRQTDSWGYNLIRITGWNSGTSTLTVDRNATTSLTKLLFTNTDAKLDPGTPTIVAGAGAGTTPAVSIIKGNDKSMQVSVLTGTGTPTGTIATITFAYPFAGGYIPSIKFSPANANSAALTGTGQVFMDSSGTGSFVITSGSAALADATTYLWNIEAN